MAEGGGAAPQAQYLNDKGADRTTESATLLCLLGGGGATERQANFTLNWARLAKYLWAFDTDVRIAPQQTSPARPQRRSARVSIWNLPNMRHRKRA